MANRRDRRRALGADTTVETRNAICLVVDGWQAGFAGPYGNSWISTPALNQLASEGFVFDQALVDSPRLDRLYRSFWRGVHAALPSERLPDGAGLASQLSRGGVATTLVTDEPRVAEHPLAAEFRETVTLNPPPPAQAAADIEDTRLAEFSAQMLDVLDEAREPFLLWGHTSSLANCWDAPREFRERYLERDAAAEEDIEHLRAEAAALARIGVAPPRAHVTSMPDPDELLALRRAYAAQISVLDACLAGLLDAVLLSPWAERTLLFVCGARGYPLGEHGRAGFELPVEQDASVGDALYAELVHVPWIWRLPGAEGALGRSAALVQPADCCATLLDWWRLARDGMSNAELGVASGRSVLPLVREEAIAWRDRALVVLDQQRALRTAAWYRLSEGELYVKPDDRWERNEIAVRCEEIAEAMDQAADDYQRAIESGEPRELAPLSAQLQAGVS
ncbi:MAG: sulfatase-like hydrolase/transferase [Pirellulales bacterium]|nr:sulfatase-like hydrolase/transferase [Pirellulales bacterium]